MARLAAILLSGGFSSRMGAFKPLLPVWDRGARIPVLERNVRLFQRAGIQEIKVVLGYRAEELWPSLEGLGVQPVFNPRFEEGMYASLVAGVQSLGPEVDAFFMLPIDLPLVRQQTLESLMSVDHPVVYPAFQGERGHPPRIATALREPIVAWSGEQGLKGLLARFDAEAVAVEVPDEGILQDMDTPADYQRILERSAHLEVPTPRECQALLSGVPAAIRGHGEQVARVAVHLGRELNASGLALDLPLLNAAGLLHDLARTEPDHAARGARTLRDRGFGRTAALVAVHMDLRLDALDASGPITAEEVLYLADKLSMGQSVVTLQERFRGAFERHRQDPALMMKLAGRLQTAQAVQDRVETATGCSLTEMMKRV
jgi:CTP:molybdopterin cytidylyltransferase MocA